MLLGVIFKICRADETKKPTFRLLRLFRSHNQGRFFSHLQNFFKKLVYIRIRLILVVTKNLKKIHPPEAEILDHEVGKYEKVTVD